MGTTTPDLDFFGNEKRQYDQFKNNHICDGNRGLDSDMKLTYSFESGIGRNTFATCKHCSLRKDITDYSVW